MGDEEAVGGFGCDAISGGSPATVDRSTISGTHNANPPGVDKPQGVDQGSVCNQLLRTVRVYTGNCSACSGDGRYRTCVSPQCGAAPSLLQNSRLGLAANGSGCCFQCDEVAFVVSGTVPVQRYQLMVVKVRRQRAGTGGGVGGGFLLWGQSKEEGSPRGRDRHVSSSRCSIRARSHIRRCPG